MGFDKEKMATDESNLGWIFPPVFTIFNWIDEPSNTTKMWHEARKQERKIRGIMVDYKKRAERRREFYEKIVSPVSQYF